MDGSGTTIGGTAAVDPAAAQEDAAPYLEANGVHAWYGSHEALRNITLAVKPRSITALIGPSGCGKSTLLRCFNRMNDAIPGFRLTGDVRVGGEQIYRPGFDPVLLRGRVGMVFQRPNPFPASVWQNVAFGPKVHGRRGRQLLDGIVKSSLTRAALWNEVGNRLGMNAGSLSGGQQQRLCIARALAVDPQALLMDEPCASLDPDSTERVESLMLELKQHMPVVLVTHNLQQAMRVADYTAFFLNGELIEYSTTDQLFNHPVDERTEAYVQGRFG